MGYAGEWFDADVGLEYLRARWYQPGTGRFTSRDPWEGNVMRSSTLQGFGYVSNNPVNRIYPFGLCEYDPYNPYTDYDCWALVEQITAIVGKGFYDYYALWSYEELEAELWFQLDPLHGQLDYRIVEREAARFGLPKEFLAAVIVAEVKYDTDWINKVYDAWTALSDLLNPDYFWADPCLYNKTLIPPSRLNLELWHYYYGLGPLYLNPAHGFGEGPAPGVGNIHAGPARDTELYFRTHYPGADLLPVRTNGQRLELLHRDAWNVRYVADYLRRYADIRTGHQGAHLHLTETDMLMTFTAYHADLAYCFVNDEGDPEQAYQQATQALEPDCNIYAEQLKPWLDFYQRNWPQ